jgi:hypothetical protein
MLKWMQGNLIPKKFLNYGVGGPLLRSGRKLSDEEGKGEVIPVLNYS